MPATAKPKREREQHLDGLRRHHSPQRGTRGHLLQTGRARASQSLTDGKCWRSHLVRRRAWHNRARFACREPPWLILAQEPTQTRPRAAPRRRHAAHNPLTAPLMVFGRGGPAGRRFTWPTCCGRDGRRDRCRSMRRRCRSSVRRNLQRRACGDPHRRAAPARRAGTRRSRYLWPSLMPPDPAR